MMGKKKKRKKGRIRPLALCVFRRGDKIFLAEGYDSHEDKVFYRPIGGKIEFGERGHETIAREVMEEIQAAVSDVTYLGALENIFRFEGQPGHEIALIYDGRFTDARLNRDDAVLQGRDDGDILYRAAWKRLDSFRRPSAPPLYPNGLLALLQGLPPACHGISTPSQSARSPLT